MSKPNQPLCVIPRSLTLAAGWVSAALLMACGGGGGGDETSAAAAPATAAGPSGDGTAPGPAPAPGPTSTEGTAGLPNFQAELLQRVNAARAAGTTCGGTAYPAAPALRWETRLQAAALGHSQDMATNNYFSHTSRDGRTFDQRIRAQGYTFSGASENIAMGQTSVAQVMASWLGSAGHCVNIMSASSQDIGVAAVRGTNGSLYWTMKIAAPAR